MLEMSTGQTLLQHDASVVRFDWAPSQSVCVGSAVVIESSDQMPRTTLLKRFPVSRNFNVTPESRIGRGNAWSPPVEASTTWYLISLIFMSSMK